MHLPSALYSLASCYTEKNKFDSTHSLMDWTCFKFILLIMLQKKICGNNGEMCPKCQTMEQNEMLRSSCAIPQWISSQRSAREELGCATCGSKLTLHWKLAQRGKMSLFLSLLAFSQQGPVATSQVSKRAMIDGWICNGENILLLPHVWFPLLLQAVSQSTAGNKQVSFLSWTSWCSRDGQFNVNSVHAH